VLGVIENMAVHVCRQCGHAEHIFGVDGGRNMAEQYGVPYLGSLPLEVGIREQSDLGVPIVVAQPQSAAALAYREAARALLAQLAERPKVRTGILSALLD
jgi:ATP-binding protein involved in chromosome partitioning